LRFRSESDAFAIEVGLSAFSAAFSKSAERIEWALVHALNDFVFEVDDFASFAALFRKSAGP
jgi:hypothetical protein